MAMNDDGGKEGKIHHGGNPVLTAAALGAAVVPDVAGNLDRLSGAGGKKCLSTIALNLSWGI